MFRRTMLTALAAGLVGFACTSAVLAADAKDAKRVTITGMGKALGDASGKLNPGVPNATLTVTTKGTKVVYYVSGWAGVIVAKQANGKKAEVWGWSPRRRAGRRSPENPWMSRSSSSRKGNYSRARWSLERRMGMLRRAFWVVTLVGLMGLVVRKSGSRG